MIFNPKAGRGRANRRLEQWRRALGPAADFRPTQYPGHAEELAFAAAQSGLTLVAAAGGDGTVHEVANGMLRAGRPEVRCAVLPLGSANDYAYSLQVQSVQRLEQGQALDELTVDVGRVRTPDGRQRYFVNTLGLGFSGAVTIEARRIRHLQGLALYGLAFLRALVFRYACPVMEIHFDDAVRKVPTFSLTVAIAHREGSFVVAPQAQLDDGLFDYLHVGALSRRQVLRFMPRLARGGQLPADYPNLWQGQCRQVRLQSASPLTVHLDGEFFSRPQDRVTTMDICLLPGALKVLAGFVESISSSHAR